MLCGIGHRRNTLDQKLIEIFCELHVGVSSVIKQKCETFLILMEQRPE